MQTYEQDQKYLLNSKMWNPIHFAIFYRQLRVLKYFIQEMNINLKVALDSPGSLDEFHEDK